MQDDRQDHHHAHIQADIRRHHSQLLNLANQGLVHRDNPKHDNQLLPPLIHPLRETQTPLTNQISLVHNQVKKRK